MKNRLLTKLIASICVFAVVISVGVMAVNAAIFEDYKENVWVSGRLKQDGSRCAIGTSGALLGTDKGNRLKIQVNLYYMNGSDERPTYGPLAYLDNAKTATFKKYCASGTKATRAYGTHINYVHWDTPNQDSATAYTAVSWR